MTETAQPAPGMHILAMRSENVKRITVVEIRPDGHLVQITGGNDQGKTSVLDSIWWAVSTTKNVQAAPIREGAEQARIRLDLGTNGKTECIVNRTFTRKEGGGFTSDLSVVNDKGFRAPSPQRLLDSFLDALSFDPLWFKRAKPAEQFEALRRFVPDFDFKANAKAHAEAYAARTTKNTDAKRHRAAASEIKVGDDVPLEAISDADLVRQLEEAGTHNASIETRKANRERAVNLIEGNAQRIAELEAEIEKLKAKNAETQKRLDEAGELPAPVDTAAIRTEIDRIRGINANVGKRQEKARQVAAGDAAEAESETLSTKMAELEAERVAVIKAAKMPVAGLSFGDDMVLYQGVPFDQASDAVQLKVSCAIGMASNAELRVMRIRDGSLLDSKSLKAIAQMARDRDYQVWIERVDETGTVGFVMEDGHLKGVTPPADDSQATQVAAE